MDTALPPTLPTRHAAAQLPLAGLRVLDFSWIIAGPLTTKMLGAMGAEVIKIESSKRAEHAARGGGYPLLNNNKHSCTIDITLPAGQDLLHRLARISDVVVENFSARVLTKYRLGYEALRAIRPDLIYVSASGVGRTGPQKDALAYGTLLQAYSGRAGLIGAPNLKLEAMGILPIWTDPVTAMWEAFAILAAVHHRRRTGDGAYLDLSMLEGTVALLPEALLRHSLEVGGQGPGGNDDGESVPGGCFRCAGPDAWLAVAVRGDLEWAGLCTVMQRPDLLAHYATAEARQAARPLLDATLSDWASGQDAAQAERRLLEAGVPAAQTRSFAGVMDDEQLAARQLFPVMSDGRRTMALPWQDATGWRGRMEPAPPLGGSNQYVMGELLGLDAAEMERLEADGVIA
jgi:benzylsuccinate CoA-transferase BbsF subunit